ncbi:Drug resistance transporter EmrB/QacA subfamily [Acididesulfobacillus acetoxydans]|uniref:Drug resistance transporter EmrB/QacA subfamily n=1 Tax=Acididesulfobacillus acetoxydans TaxID=1561005 RepID=A0A8S0XAZ9_9FIRM|nr:DHA2 family efflux MFS transporter permease subunit [Acididesulfobacillus acetoxydans]CAA7600596.1 Drug resistance transporter EmrB/QacA subfamily [Acididesulfobacillus acetoxydans]CEJ09377.1 Lincomycin resistance protein LmrB [Acididesulfobacillus acetoxydans]
MSFEERFGIKALTMVSVVLGVFMVILDTSVVNVAIPKMMSVFATDQTTIEWVITGYTLTVGMLTPASGYLADRFGMKRIYILALSIFVLGSALSGAAWSSSSIITFRIVQAVGGALLLPVSMTILFSLSKPEKRGLMMGIWGIASMFAPAFGPTLSGYIVQNLNFRLIFYINVPVGIFNILIARTAIPKFEARDAGKFDWPGMVTSLIGFFCLLYGFSDVPTSGWHSAEIISLFLAAGIFLSLFVVLELTTDNPMVELRLLKIRPFLVANIAAGILRIAMMGTLFLLPVFLQNGLGLTPLQTGLLTMPGALLTAVLLPISGAMFDKVGARPLAILGLSIMTVASFFLVNLNYNWSFMSIMMIYMFRQSGMGLSNMPLSTAGMNAVPRRYYNKASALQNTLRNVAGSFGTAILSTVMQNHENYSLISYLQNTSAQSLQGVNTYGMQPSVFAAKAPSVLLRFMLVLKGIAFQNGIREALTVATMFTAVALLSAFFVGKKQVPVA